MKNIDFDRMSMIWHDLKEYLVRDWFYVSEIWSIYIKCKFHLYWKDDVKVTTAEQDQEVISFQDDPYQAHLHDWHFFISSSSVIFRNFTCHVHNDNRNSHDVDDQIQGVLTKTASWDKQYHKVPSVSEDRHGHRILTGSFFGSYVSIWTFFLKEFGKCATDGRDTRPSQPRFVVHITKNITKDTTKGKDAYSIVTVTRRNRHASVHCATLWISVSRTSQGDQRTPRMLSRTPNLNDRKYPKDRDDPKTMDPIDFRGDDHDAGSRILRYGGCHDCNTTQCKSTSQKASARTENEVVQYESWHWWVQSEVRLSKRIESQSTDKVRLSKIDRRDCHGDWIYVPSHISWNLKTVHTWNAHE